MFLKNFLMKYCLVLFLLALLKLCNVSVYSQVPDLKIPSVEMALQDFLDEVEQQTGYRFLYHLETIKGKRITPDVEGKTVSEILDQLKYQANVNYRVLENNLIVITPLEIDLSREEIRGKVTDNQGNPLPGVNVIIKGTRQGTVTNVNGNYAIDFIRREDDVLVFSFVGYRTKEVPVSDKKNIQVTMQPDIVGLDEVVVIGYGALRRADVTGSVSSISANQIGKYSFPDVDQVMQGKLSGVTIQQDAAPGGGGDIRIRGLSTISNNEPLVVIDGLPGGYLSDINPNDISSISVLKDASAAAIYGNKASNGVIMVTTKKGRKNQEAEIHFSSEFGFSQVLKRIDLLNTEQYIQVMDEMIANGLAQGTVAEGSFNKNIEGFTPVNTDWQEEIFRNALNQNHNLAISGGAKKTNYYFSGNIRDYQGVIINSGQKKYTLTSNFEYQISDVFTLGENLTLSYLDINRVINHNSRGWSGTVLSALTTSPAIPAFDDQGHYADPFPPEGYAYYGTGNAVRTSEREGSNQKTNILGSAFLNADITKHLSFNSRIGLNFGQILYRNYEPGRSFPRPVIKDNIEKRYTIDRLWTWDNTVNYQRSFGDHQLKMMAGNSLQKNHFSIFGASRVDLLNHTSPFQYLDFGDPENQFNFGAANSSSLASFFGRVVYNYRDKYLLTATLRHDGSSKFIKGKKYGTFPSFAIGWRIHKEKFLNNIQDIDNIKIRAGWGQVGNQNIGTNYPYLNLIELGHGYVFGPGDGSYAQGVAEISNGNPDLTWETSTMANLGLDMGFFNRINLVMDYFTNKTTDMLLPVELPALNGKAQAPYQNIGIVRSSGFEYNVDYYLFNSEFEWSISFNGAFLENEVLDLGGSDLIQGGTKMANLTDEQPVMRTVVGKPISSFYGYKMEGIFQTRAEVDNHAFQQEGTRPGDIKFADLNEDGVVNDKDRTFLGDGYPDFIYGFSMEGSYKAFDFSMYFDGNSKVRVYNGVNMRLMNTSINGNKNKDLLQYWDGPGSGNKVPRLIYNDPNNNNRISDYFIEDASFFRLKGIEAGYTLPDKFIRNLGIQQMRFSVSAQNLFMFTQYSGINPEVRSLRRQGTANSLEGSAGAAFDDFQRDLNLGFDTGVYPVSRSFFAGLNIVF